MSNSKDRKIRNKEVDNYIGRKIKESRLIKKMTQSDLGQEISLTFQQVQKYEKGINCISASRLYYLAKVLEVEINDFFPGDAFQKEQADQSSTLHEQGNFEYNKYPESKEILVLVREYANVRSKKVRNAIYSLVKSLSALANESK
ncbi:helix-turn-helix transcriptional regulator [Candidatus Mesenet endosymbiont of Agriotes lineatus]|uniref:helix-turn-helix domain-containing protein n=1 Tax=Candidatus Mesenet endosymbiont of Agriotes lineatus TaxID=3077948 RepID=UPI0030D2909B